MTKKELLKELEGVPDDAIVYIWSDHGHASMMGNYVYTSTFKGDVKKWADWDDEIFLHKDDQTPEDFGETVTAVCIGSGG